MQYRNRSSDQFVENRKRPTTAAAGSPDSRAEQLADSVAGSAHTVTAKGFNAYKETVADGLRAGRNAAGRRLNPKLQATASGIRYNATNTARGIRYSVVGAVCGTGVAHNLLSDFVENLDWSTVNPAKYMRAGTRGTSRSMDEARRVWESIPKPLRALGDDEVLNRIRGFDWSHIRPHSQGGSNAASNGLFEAADLNRRRGAKVMTSAEIEAAQKALSSLAFRATCTKIVTSAFNGAIRGVGVVCALAVFEHLLEYQQDKISWDEMRRRIMIDVGKSGLSGATIAGVMTIIAMVCPALIPVVAVLMQPPAILGPCLMIHKVVKLIMGWYELVFARRRRTSVGSRQHSWDAWHSGDASGVVPELQRGECQHHDANDASGVVARTLDYSHLVALSAMLVFMTERLWGVQTCIEAP